MGSAGCGRVWAPGADVHGALVYGGLVRTYLLHVPAGYAPATPAPLLLSLHGSCMNADEQALLTHMSRTADAAGFVVVYPNGTGSPRGWNVFPAAMAGAVANAYAGVDDVGFLNALVGSLEDQLCIDAARIGVAGFSLGAAMAYHLACSDEPWLAAIAVVGGTMPQPANLCTLAHPTPLIAFHGVLDPVLPYGGAGASPQVPTVVAVWAMLNGCAGPPQDFFTSGDVSAQDFSTCMAGQTQLYTVADGGHTWPGGVAVPALGVTSNSVDASALIWSFLDAHPLGSNDTVAAQTSPTSTASSQDASSITVLPPATSPTAIAAAAARPVARRSHGRHPIARLLRVLRRAPPPLARFRRFCRADATAPNGRLAFVRRRRRSIA